MAASADELQRALEWAKRNNDQEAVDAVTAELEKMQRGKGALPDNYRPGEASARIEAASDPMPLEKATQGKRDYSVENRPGALPKFDYTDPEQYEQAGALQMKRERDLAQATYEADQRLVRDKNNLPSRQEMNEFLSKNANIQFGAGPINTLQQQLIKDPKTGKVRWTALSPEQMDRLDKRGSTTSGAIGALAYGSTRLPGAALSNVEADIDRLNNFQNFLLTGERGLPKAEQERIMGLAVEKYGADSKYVKDPGLIPANVVRDWINMNPDNEDAMDRIVGREWGESRKEWWKRLGNRMSAVVPGMPVNIFGADETLGALTGREQYEGIEYEEGEDPAYPGVSEDMRDWQSHSKRNPGVYEHVVKPILTNTLGGKTPAERMVEASEDVRKKFYTEEQEAERQMPMFAKEITKFSDLLDPEMYEGTKFQNPESLFLMFLENAPELGLSFAVTRGAGGAAARGAAARNAGQTLERMNKAREAAGARAGMLAGGATEGLIVQEHVENETRDVLSQIPIETWQENALYQKMVESGLNPEEAKQILTQQAASQAGTTAAAITMATGAPMNRFMGRSAAGRLVQSKPGLRRTTGLVGEPLTEGAQEVMEMLQTEAAVRPIDPDNPIFKDPNRYAEAFAAGAIISLPFGAASALEPSTPEGIDKADAEVARLTANYMQATNERFKFESQIADPEHIADTSPNERLIELEKLERLQEREAQALLKAEPKMREHLEKQGTLTAQTELKMLNRLKMRANAIKTDIAVARSKRTTATQLQEAERQVMQDRADLQKRVSDAVLKLEDIERLTGAIETVQNLGAVSNAQADELIKEGYARRKADGNLTILPKGRRATKELNRQARGLRARLEGGYTGPERRADAVRRETIEAGGPQQREKLLYTDPLTDVQNRRAFNERQENIDVKEGQEAAVIEGAMPAVASVDIDSLKWVNDNMTHAAGDRLISAVGDALNKQAGVEVYRMGGDEFAVAGQSQEQLETALQAAAAELSQTPIVAGNDEVTPQITWGKGENYEQADAESIAMKRDRIQRGVTAKRTGQPATYKVRSQQGLFAKGEELTEDQRRMIEDGVIERTGPWQRVVEQAINSGLAKGDEVVLQTNVENKRDEDVVRGSVNSIDKKKNEITVLTENGSTITFDRYGYMPVKGKRSISKREAGWVGENVSRAESSFARWEKAGGNAAKRSSAVRLKSLAVKDNRQLGLFQMDEGQRLPTSWGRIRNKVKKGDVVEILTPSGATFGMVKAKSANRGRPRVYVSVEGRIFKFNPDKNHLIVDKFTSPTDLAWITGDAEYAQPGRETFPQTLSDVGIGHVGDNYGNWYADLGVEPEYITPDPWWMDTYPELKLERAAPVVRLPKATDEQQARAMAVVEQLTDGYANLPPINIVQDMAQLKQDAPQVVQQMIAEGGNLTSVRGYMDHLNPNNGIYVFVPNVAKFGGDKYLEQHIAETLLHEMIGHYGVRGVFGDERKLRYFTDSMVDSFPRLADYYAQRLGLDKTNPDDKQLLGEEMIAYVAGEVMSGNIKFTQRQQNLWQKFLAWVRDFMRRRGWDRWSPVKKMVTLDDSKEQFWTDERIQHLLVRADDFLRNGKGFEWRALGGSRQTYMRDGNIFQSGLLTALNTATFKPSNREKKELASRYGGKENVPDEVPLFPESAKIGRWKELIIKAQKDGLMTKRELELSALDESADWYLFRDLTYYDMKQMLDEHRGTEDPDWYRGIVPHNIAQEIDAIREAQAKNTVIGPMPRGNYNLNADNQYKETAKRPVVNEVSARLMYERLSEIMSAKVNPKNTIITKELIEAHLLGEKAYRVSVRQHGDHARRNISREGIVRRLFGELTPDEINNLTEEQLEMIRVEKEAIEKYGYDIGYDPDQDRWFDWNMHTSEYSEWSPQGSRINADFRVALITTEGGGTEMGYTGHYNANLMHIRTGEAELLDWEGKPLLTFPNPEKENRLLSLIELQSDWLQKLRKGFSSGAEKQATEQQFAADNNALKNVAITFGEGVAEDLFIASKKKLTALANLPDGGEQAEGLTGGSLFPRMKEEVRNRLGRNWEDLSASEKQEQWKDFIQQEIAVMNLELSTLVEDLRQQRNDIKFASDLGGTLDARTFERLDNHVLHLVLDYLAADIDSMRDWLTNNIAYASSQLGIARSIQEWGERAFYRIKNYGSNSDTGAIKRLPMVDYSIKPVLDKVYEQLGADPSAVAARISATKVREAATARIPKSAIKDLATAMAIRQEPETLLQDILMPSRLARHGDMSANAVSLNIFSPNPEWLDVRMTGSKADIQKMGDLLPVLVNTWIEEQGQKQRDIMMRQLQDRSRGSASSYTNEDDYTYQDLRDMYGLEEADVEEGDNDTRNEGVTTFYEYEENNISEIESELIDDAFNNITEDEWNNLDNDNPGVGRNGDTYREALIIDEDGDVDNSDAEEALEEAREEYRRDVLWDDEDLRMQAYDQIREKWYDEGPTALILGSLPIRWDTDGDAVDHVQIKIIAREPGDPYRIEIDGEEYDYNYNLDDSKNALSDQIRQYYEDNEIAPPPDEFFGKDKPDADEEADTEAVSPNWDIVSGNISENISIISDKSEPMDKVFERYVSNMKRLDNGQVHKPSPLAKDEHWRPVALKYLIADAVRRGLGGIIWNNGLASSTRGGMGLTDVTRTERITWTKETMDIRGKEHSVYVIRSPDLNKPLVVAPNKMVPVLGADVTSKIMQQEKGKLAIPDITKKSDEDQSADEEFQPRDNYLISRTPNNVYVLYRRSNHEQIGFANNDEELDAMIERDQERYGRIQEQEAEREAARGRGVNLEALEPTGKEIVSKGIITENMLGNKIHVITGGTTRGYRNTFAVPKLAGARQSYEDITVSIWNKELKKYNTYIKETYVEASNMRKAVSDEGASTLMTGNRDERIKEDHGSLSIQELTGEMHGWVVMSEKKGLLFQDVWQNKEWAEDRLKEYIEDNYGDDVRGVKVMYIEITDEMREEFSKPVAPFMLGFNEEPEGLKTARQKVGAPKGTRMRDLRDRMKVFREGFAAEVQQGMVDQFYGLKRALREAGIDEGAYISARLTTSLDSMMKSILYEGHPVWKDGIMQTEGRGLMDVLQPILKQHEDWGLFMAGRRSKRLLLEGYDKLKPVDKAAIDKAAAHFDGDILEMMAWFAEYDQSTERDPGTYAPRELSSAERKMLRKWEGEIDDLVAARDNNEYRDRDGRRVPREWLEENVERLRNKLLGVARRQVQPSDDFIKGIEDKIKFYEDQLNPQPEIDRLKAMVAALEAEQAGTKPRKRKRWAKRDDVLAADFAIAELVQNGREHLFTPREIRDMINLGESRPVFKRVADDYAAFNKRMLDFAEASGLIDKDQRPTWENADYVPFYRLQEDSLMGSSLSPTSGLANQRAPIRRLTGGKQHIGDIVGNIMVNAAKLVDASVKNNAALEAIDALRGTGTVSPQPLDWKPVLITMDQLKKVMIDRGIIVPDDEEGIHIGDIPREALEGIQKMFALTAPKGEGIMSVMRNGKREYYYTDDPLLFRSMTSINKKNFGEWIRLFSGPKRFLTTMITIDPSFMIANFIRDSGSAFVIGRDHWGNVPFVSAAKGFGEALLKDKAVRTMTSAGAAFENGYITGGDPRETRRIIKEAMKDPGFFMTVLDTPAKLLRAWKTLGAAVENANRVAIYNAAIAAGKSKKRAAFEAKDLMDFSMGGDYTLIRFLIQTVPFMNARLQGNYRLGKSMVEHPIAFTMKGMLVGMAGFALWAAFKDDERYKELEMWDRHAYFHWWIGDMHYRLPKPFEVGALFNTQVEMWGNYLNDKENDAGKMLLREYGHMMGETFNLLPAPQLALPVFESMFNYSFFKQGPLVGFYEKKRLPPDQYRYRTSPTIRELAKALPKGLDTVSGKIRSPLHLQNLYAGYTGTIGKYLLQVSDVMVQHALDYPLPPAYETQDYPVWGRFVRGDTPARRTKYEDAVYRQLNKTAEIQGSLSFHRKYGNVDEYLKTFNDPDYQPYIRSAKSLEGIRENIQEVNKAIQLIYLNRNLDEEGNKLVETDERYLSPEEKRKQIDDLERTRNMLFREAYKLRPGGEYNPAGSPPATQSQAIEMIDEWGVDNSTAFMRRLEGTAPTTYELLEMIQNDMASRQLLSLAKAGGSK